MNNKNRKKYDLDIFARHVENCVFGGVKFAFNCIGQQSRNLHPFPESELKSEIKFDISIFVTSPGC